MLEQQMSESGSCSRVLQSTAIPSRYRHSGAMSARVAVAAEAESQKHSSSDPTLEICRGCQSTVQHATDNVQPTRDVSATRQHATCNAGPTSTEQPACKIQ